MYRPTYITDVSGMVQSRNQDHILHTVVLRNVFQSIFQFTLAVTLRCDFDQ